MLRQLRERAGLTQEQLEERSGVAVRSIRRLESGERANPRMDTVQGLSDALSEALDVRPDIIRQLLAGVPAATLGLTLNERQCLSFPPSDGPVLGGIADLPVEGSQDENGPKESDNGALLKGGLAEAAEQLAQEVRKRWTLEEEQRMAHGPFLMPVRWQSAPRHPGIRPGSAATGQIPAGELNEIACKYQMIKESPKRLVVLGRPGSGKTTLTLRFILDHLDKRGEGEPVPVAFSLGSWDPGEADLRDWLIDQLLRDYPALLASCPGGSTMAAELVAAGGILPVLDGFDEIAEGLYGDALDKLDNTSLPMLLTSRIDEYAEAVEAAGVLTGAAVVELSALTPADLADYLPRTTRGTVWDPVLAQLHEHPDSLACSNLASVLSTPLMVTLARAMYCPASDRNPTDLLENFPTTEALEDHLLGGFVPAVYPRKRDHERVQNWLGYLAWTLSQPGDRDSDQPGIRDGRYDLEWWRLGDSLSRRSRVLAVFLMSTLVAVPIEILTSLSVTLAYPRAAATINADVLAGLLNGTIVGLSFGLLYMRMVVSGRVTIKPSRMQPRLPGRARVTGTERPRRFTTWFGAGLLAGMTVGLGIGPALVLEQPLLSGTRTSILVAINTAFTTALVSGVIFGLAAGLAFGLVATVEAPLDLDSAATPQVLLTANRRTVVRHALLLAPLLAFAIAIGGRLIADLLNLLNLIRPLITITWPWTDALVSGMVGGIAGALSYAFAFTAWGQWVVLSRICLPLTGRLPWAMTAFLNEAYERGVLRQAGAVYQFRHARLQNHLSRAYQARHTNGLALQDRSPVRHECHNDSSPPPSCGVTAHLHSGEDYPAHVHAVTLNMSELEETILLAMDDDPAALLTAEFEERGWQLSSDGLMYRVTGTFTNPLNVAAQVATQLGRSLGPVLVRAQAGNRWAFIAWRRPDLLLASEPGHAWRQYRIDGAVTPASRFAGGEGIPAAGLIGRPVPFGKGLPPASLDLLGAAGADPAEVLTRVFHPHSDVS
jgi:transcriptional regulator with XRE-family HTH domain